jgi:hypothetical protein
MAPKSLIEGVEAAGAVGVFEPALLVFQNGPNWGHDVFIPMDNVIGGIDQVGKGASVRERIFQNRASARTFSSMIVCPDSKVARRLRSTASRVHLTGKEHQILEFLCARARR